MTQQDHAAAVQLIREAADESEKYNSGPPGYLPYTQALRYVAAMADAALVLEQALRKIDHEVRGNDLFVVDDPDHPLIEAHRICDKVAEICEAALSTIEQARKG